MANNPSKLSSVEREQRMMAKLTRNESIENFDDMSDEYHEHLTIT